MPRFDIESRILLKEGLDQGMEIRKLAETLGMNRTSISREIQRHRATTETEGKPSCPKLASPPFVCNSCADKKRCRLPKWFYLAEKAEAEYKRNLVASRQGYNLTPEELEQIGSIIDDGIAKGQSVHHIMLSRRTEFTVSEKTVYNLINAGAIRTKRHRLPEAPYRRLKHRKNKASEHKVDRKCRLGREMEDFREFLDRHPDTHVVEMDTVLGRIGGKVLLTVNFDCCGLMLAFLRDRNDAKSVIDIFDDLERKLGGDLFRRLFPVILTDNGSEFSAPGELEKDSCGHCRTRVFYCNPYSSYEKPHVENNHRNLRKVLEKGTSFDNLTQERIDFIMSNVNSMLRKEYGNTSAAARFTKIYGKSVLDKLGIREIPPKEVCLLPAMAKE